MRSQDRMTAVVGVRTCTSFLWRHCHDLLRQHGGSGLRTMGLTDIDVGPGLFGVNLLLRSCAANRTSERVIGTRAEWLLCRLHTAASRALSSSEQKV